MGRLTALPPRLKPVGNRLASMSRPEAEAQRLRQRDKEVKWRGWYKQARWERLRKEVFLRDGYICQQTGVIVMGRGQEPSSPVAHHKIAHKGDPDLFWDINNIETVSKAWHDGPGQAAERRANRDR